MSDGSVLLVSAAMGAAGGVVATLVPAEAITARQLTLRILASVMMSVALVGGYFVWTAATPTYMAVYSLACICGMSAWYVVLALPRLVPMAIREALKRATGVTPPDGKP